MKNIILNFLTKLLTGLLLHWVTTLIKDKLLPLFKREKEKTLKLTNTTSVSETEYNSDLEITIPFFLRFRHSFKRKAVNNQSTNI
jgi:hypothetical protein